MKLDVWSPKCPVCGSAPFRPCYGGGDMPRGMTHRERVLLANRTQAKAEALREAAEAFSKELGSNAANPGPKYVVGWLHNRAAKLEGK